MLMKKWIVPLLTICLLLCGCSMEVIVPEEEIPIPQLTVHYLDVG